MALRAYNSPGVTVSESIDQGVTPLLATPSVIALVGAASGSQTASERIVLTGTTPVTFRYTGINTGTVIVKNAFTGNVINAGAYTIALGTDPNPNVLGDQPATIARNYQSTVAPTVAVGSGSLTGTYHYAVSFLNATGETGIGPHSTDITVTGTGISLTGIEIGPAGTTGRNIYREKVVSGVGQGYHLVANLNNNTVTTLPNETVDDVTVLNFAAPVNGINDGDSVLVTYTYTDNFYYAPTTFDNYNDIITKYGSPYDTNGNISSPLTFAARLAFMNGASELITVAQTDTSSAALTAALAQLEDVPEVRIVIIASGSPNDHSSVIAHVDKMNAQGLYRFTVLGRDGTTTNYTPDTMRQAARAINDEAVQLINATVFQMQNAVTGRPLNVGGQYMAAAIGGMWSGRDVQFPLTRKTVAGFSDIVDKRTASDRAIDSASGLLVIKISGGVLVVRHSVTTNIGSLSSREGSVVRAKYEMAHRLKDILDSSIVGIVAPTDRVPLIVQSGVVGILEQLIIEQVISGYSDVTARTSATDPSTVEVKFSYSPAYPINNISVVFSVDTTSGDFALTTT